MIQGHVLWKQAGMGQHPRALTRTVSEENPGVLFPAPLAFSLCSACCPVL